VVLEHYLFLRGSVFCEGQIKKKLSEKNKVQLILLPHPREMRKSACNLRVKQ
jgi:hypothetical protein